MSNRAQRRQDEIMQRIREKERIAQENKDIVRKLKDIEQEAKDWACHYYMGLMFVATAKALHDEYGWTARPIGKIWHRMDDILCSLETEDGMTVEQLAKWVEDKLHLRVEFDSNRNIVAVNTFEREVEKDA